MPRLCHYLELFKLPMSLLITLSAVFGFVLRSNRISPSLILTGIGILFLAGGSAALNNFQDRHLDRLLSRTRCRVLPTGKVSPVCALSVSVVFLCMGFLLLYLVDHRFFLPILGAAAVALYNGIYTPLKSRTVLAIIPGAMCGMMPPLIGWSAAGGNPFSAEIISIMVLFGLWQFPHFWLILLSHCAEYERCNIPNMLRQFSRSQLERMVFIWIVNVAVMIVFVSFLYWEPSHAGKWLFSGIALIMIGTAGFWIFITRSGKNFGWLFRALNGSVFFVMAAVIVDRLLLSA